MIRNRGPFAAMRAGGLICALALGAAGCAEVQFVSQASKELSGQEAVNPGRITPDSGARYKVGDAYQIKGVWYYPKVDFDYVEEGIASWYGPNFHGETTANGAVFDMNKVSAAHRTLPLPSMVRVTNLENGRAIKVVVNDRGPFARDRIIDISRRGAELLGYRQQGTALVRVEILPEESRKLAAAARGERPTPRLATAAEPAAPSAAPAPSVESESLAPPPGTAQAEAPSSERRVDDPGSAERAEAAPRADAEAVVASAGQEATGEEVSYVGVPASPDIFIQAGAFAQHLNAVQTRARLSSIAPVRIEQINRSDTPLFRVRLGPVKGTARADSVLAAVRNAGFQDARIVVPQ